MQFGQLKRRELITLLGGAAAWPLAARAQPSGQMRRVALLFGLGEHDDLGRAYLTAFQKRFQELGWIEGRNARFDIRWAADNPALARSHARELVSFNPDVMFCQSGPAFIALREQTSTIPIVFTQVTDPLASGYVASLARPGGNVTGFALSEFAMAGKLAEVLKEVAPGTNRVTVLFNSALAPQIGMLKSIQDVAPSLRVSVTAASVRDTADIEQAIDPLANAADAGLIVLPNPITNRHRDLIVALAFRHRLPSVYRYRYFVANGGLLSYGERPEVSIAAAASYVDRILKGDKPGDLPVQQPTKFELIVNLKTAKAIGLTIPDSVLALADEVIE